MARLLLLDDDAAALELLTDALAGVGHDVHAYGSGSEALEHLRHWRPDLIVADIFMPQMDGIAFARLVRSCGGPPVLFVSIATKQADAVLAGAVGYVQKPATANEIRRAVSTVLGKPGRKVTILIVDDDSAARELFGHALRPAFDVIEAEDGFAALHTLREHAIDLVITDFRMPLLNGAELVREMRADPELQRIPVIVQSSDRAALASPVWKDLGVAYQLDKHDFFQWLRSSVDARLPGSTKNRTK